MVPTCHHGYYQWLIGKVVCQCCMLGVGVLLVIYFCHCHCIVFFVCLLCCFICKYTRDNSRSWCTPGCHSLSSVPNWGGSRSSCSFLYSPGRVARAGVPLAVHPFFYAIFFVHLPGTVARVGMPLVVHPLFILSLNGVVAGVGVALSIHLCFSFLFFCFVFLFVDTPMWDSGRSWCAPGCPSFLLKPKWGVVAEVGVPLATHRFLLLLLFFIYVGQ